MSPRKGSAVEFTESDALELVGALKQSGVEFWIDGGWGVDALIERQTRPHADIDIVLRDSDVPAMIRAVASLGYTREPEGRPFNFFMIDSLGRQIDVHTVVFDDQGDGLYGPQLHDGSRLKYPASAFSGTGKIGGVPVNCLAAEYQVVNHSGYEFDERDIHDLRLLQERFGLEGQS